MTRAAIPLDPGAGGACLSIAALQPADILVSTTSAAVSRVIRGFTSSQVSHAMLYAGDGRVIEAVGEGVVERPAELAFAESTLVVAYRQSRVTPQQGRTIVQWARRQATARRRYDASGAAGAGARDNLAGCVIILGALLCAVARSGGFNAQDRFFCSELVLQAFQEAGVPIGTIAPATASPQRLVEAHATGLLQYVGHLKV